MVESVYWSHSSPKADGEHYLHKKTELVRALLEQPVPINFRDKTCLSIWFFLNFMPKCILHMTKKFPHSIWAIAKLILADNVIERLPMNLGKLQSLKVMTLDGHKVTTLPDEFGQLVKPERLSISRNLLIQLPETIGSLRNLVLLNISNNKIKFLPESIGSCYSLEEFQANENSIEELPASVCNLVNLKSLCLDNNDVKQVYGDEEWSFGFLM